MAFPSDFTQQVKNAADIARVIGETVALKKSGNNYIGLCPFHQEKTPSFSVHATRQFYYCFGCGAKGDVFRFVMEMEKVPFPEAVRRVAQRTGIPIPAHSSKDEAATPEARLRKALEEVHERAEAFYRKQLGSAEALPVRELIRQRGLTEDSVEEFGLGFAPASGEALTGYLNREGFPMDVQEASGLVLRRETGGHFDRFRNRWIFPIAGETGKTIAFAGRALGSDQPKYLNSPETALYSKSRVLYNLSRARDAIRKSNAALLVEGYMDVIAVWQAGVCNVVASCGTSLTEPQAHMLARYGPEVIVGYDPDSAGVAATDRSLGLLLENGMTVRILRLPGALDPDEYIRQSGAEAYRARLNEAQPVFRYLAGRAIEIHGKSSPEAKLAALNFVLPFVARVPNQLIRAELAADIAQKMDVSTGLVWEAFRKAALERRDSVQTPSSRANRNPSAELIRLLLDSKEARKEMAPLLLQKGLCEELEFGTILSTLVGMIAGGSAPDLASLADRLDEGQQRLLAEVVFDKEARPVSIYDIKTYISSLERKRLERQRLEVQKKIHEAQQSRDTETMLRLIREKNELDKELSKLL